MVNLCGIAWSFRNSTLINEGLNPLKLIKMGDIKSVFYRIKELRREQGKNEKWLIEKLTEKYPTQLIKITRISLLTSLAVDILWKKMKLENDLMKREDDESEDHRCHNGQR